MYPTLETERLTLRPWQLGDELRLMDFAEVLNATIPDNELPQIHSLEDAKWIVEDNIKDDNQWAVVYKPDNLLIGWLGIGGPKIRESAAIWLWIDEPYWNRGICGEALAKAVHFAFYGLKTKCVNIRLCENNYHINQSDYDYALPSAKTSPYSFDNPVRKIDSIAYIKQPTEYLCGQSVIAMLAGVSVNEVISVAQTDLGMDIPEMRDALEWYGLKTTTKERKKYRKFLGGKLPDCCVLSVRLPEYGHWSLYYKGKFYDPEFGVLDKLPKRARLVSYWEVI